MTLTSSFRDDVSPWLGYQDGKNSDGLSWFIFYLHHTVWQEGLCSALQAVCYRQTWSRYSSFYRCGFRLSRVHRSKSLL